LKSHAPSAEYSPAEESVINLLMDIATHLKL
jgi:hypothetical protein